MKKCIRSSEAYYYIINPEFIYKCMCSSKVYYYIINPEFVFILINLRNTFFKRFKQNRSKFLHLFCHPERRLNRCLQGSVSGIRLNVLTVYFRGPSRCVSQ